MEKVRIICEACVPGSWHCADGSVAFCNKLSRGKLLSFLALQPRCVVAMEPCPGSHHWGPEIEALGQPGAADRAGLREAVRSNVRSVRRQGF